MAQQLASDIIHNRYVLEQRIGQGGMGVVYRVKDRLKQQPVALKRVLMPNREDQQVAAMSLMLAREFETLASLRHPHIISVLDYGFDSAGQPFYTMELLERTRSLIEAGALLTPVERIRLLIQILQALWYLHRRGIIHRDLKPDNALVTPDGVVRLLDFGLAVLRERASGETLAGTLHYMAPEVLRGETPTEAADLFAVGLIAYELLVGTHPFATSSTHNMLAQMLTREPDLTPLYDLPLVAAAHEPRSDSDKPTSPAVTAPETVTRTLEVTDPFVEANTLILNRENATRDLAETLLLDNLPADTGDMSGESDGGSRNTLILDDEIFKPRQPHQPRAGTVPSAHYGLAFVIGKLLAKDPTVRYRDARQVILDLSQIIGEPLTGETEATRESFLQAARFVGRAEELDTLITALYQAKAGQGSVWLVRGESGVGKSRLLDELRTRALVTGAAVVRGQATEADYVYQLWREPILRLALNVSLDESAVASLRAIAGDAISTLLGAADSTLPELDPQEAKQRLFAALNQLVSQQPQPVVILLDDLHLAQSESLAVLRHLAQMVTQHRVLIVGSYSDDEDSHLIEQMIEAPTITLPRLNETEIAELSESMLGEAARQPDVLALLRRQTEGNVYFLVEIVRVLAEEAGALDRISADKLPQTVIAGGIRRLVERRLQRLPDEHHAWLRLAAVAGRRIDTAVMSAATSANVTPWLFACAQASILEIRDEQWRFTHNQVREEVLAAIPADALPELHTRIAHAIEQTYPDVDTYAGVLADHWHAAGDAERELASLRRAGARAYQSSAFREAIRFYERALVLIDADAADQRAVLTVKLAQIYIQLGDYDQAQQLLEAGLRDAETSVHIGAQADAMLSLGHLSYYEGDYAEAEMRLTNSLMLYRKVGQHKGIADALRGLAVVADMRGAFADAVAHYEESLALSRLLEDHWIIAKTLNGLGVIALGQGDFDAARARTEEALALFRQVGSRVGEAETLSNLGQLAFYEERYGEAAAHLQHSLTLYREIGNQHAVADLLNNLGYGALMENDFETAKARLEESLALLEKLDVPWSVANTLTNLGHVASAQGDRVEAFTRFREGLVKALAIQAEPLLIEIVAGIAKLYADADELQTALTLAGAIKEHPAADNSVRETVQSIIAAAAEQLPDDIAQTQLEQGKPEDLVQLVLQLIDLTAI